MRYLVTFLVLWFSECEEYSRGVVEKVDYLPLLPDPDILSISAAKCDYTGIKLIVGGENANNGEFPHMVKMIIKSFIAFRSLIFLD